MNITEEIKEAIKRLNSVSCLQYVENVESVEQIEELLPTLYTEADAIVIAVQRLESAILKVKD